MSAAADQERFEELDAGRALGDLDAVEAAEWQQLVTRLGEQPSAEFDQIAAELEIAEIGSADAPLPPALAERLKRDLPAPATSPSAEPAASPAPPRGRIALFPWVGWAVAAFLLILLMLRSDPPTTETITADQQRENLISQAPDARQLEFSPAGEEFERISGDVVWSDALQQGFMKLSQLPANDPSQAQYQLWIIDPERDEFPVDGGVFDIPESAGSVVIPIRNALPVSDPAAFVITVEQPGGVVRSKQESVVALAQS